MNASLAPELELQDAHVTIVGLGLMGGSLALGLKSHVRKLTAVELDRHTRRMARERDIVQEVTVDLRQGTAEADVIILATPVGAIRQIVEQLPHWRSRGCYLLDLGSTKRRICAAMDAMPRDFVAMGGHPMCGKESSGLAFAEETLYEGQTFVLCRTKRTNEALEYLALSMLDAVGAVPLFLEAEEHDRLVAKVSHLPYFISALLMQQAAAGAEQEKDLWSLSASGFRDTSRLAGSDPLMLYDIVETNRDAILRELRRYSTDFQEVIAMLDSDDDASLRVWLKARQDEHRRYRRAMKSAARFGS